MQLNCPHCQKANRFPDERIGDGPTCGACGQALFSGVHAVDSTGLAALTAQARVPVIVDFWAPWCAPCRSFAPTFAAAAQKHGDRLVFAKVDTEANQDLGAKFNIRSIPTLAVFNGTQELGRVSGALPPAQLEDLIQQVLQQVSK
ncbi:MAG: thioredoxin TrxC [Burkholderiaceae bacterium]|nr:thioredoxin TrxC [Burkholderiaceae bacterium]